MYSDSSSVHTLPRLKEHSLALRPNCHWHCWSALYISPGSLVGNWYLDIPTGSSHVHLARSVLDSAMKRSMDGVNLDIMTNGKKEGDLQMKEIKL